MWRIRRLLGRLLVSVGCAVAAGGAGPAAAQPPDNIYSLSAASLQNQATQVGTAFAENMSVLVSRLDRTGVGVGVPVTFTAPASGPSGTFATTGTNEVTVASGENGIATAPVFTANLETGSFSVGVSAPQANPNFFFFTNAEDPASKAFSISVGNGSNQAAQIDTTFAIAMTVTVFNGSGAQLPGVEVVFAAPSSGPSGTFPGGLQATVVTGATGQAVAPPFTANGVDGSYVVTATVDGSQTTDGNPLSASFALRNSLNNPIGVPEIVSAAAGNGQQTPVLTAFNVNLQVVVLDGSLNHVQGAEVIFTAPDTGPSGTFDGGGMSFTTTSGPTGLATAPTFTANDVAGSYGVVVTATKDGVSAEGVIGLTNGRVQTTTVLDVSPPGSSLQGQTVTLTATVTAAVGTLVPAANVEFRNGGATIGTCAAVAPSAGVAACVLDGLAPASYLFQALYAGDAVSQPSQSAAVAHEVIPVVPPTFTKSFSPVSILPGAVSRLTFTIDSTANTVEVPDIAFIDNLPAGVTVAASPDASTDCTGGVLTAVAGSGVVSYTGGAVAAGASCTIGVNVTATDSGQHANTTSELTSAAGTAGTATSTLEVAASPTFAKSFSPVSILPGAESRLTFTIDNTANTIEIPDLAFTDNLPAAVTVAASPDASSDCAGGMVTTVAGSGVVSYTGGAIPAGATCTIAVNVTGTASGQHENTSGALTSAAGTSGAATATLEVATVAKMFAIQAATGTGQITGTIAGGGPACGVDDAEALDLTAVDAQGPNGVELPHGLIRLELGNCEPGASVEVTLTLPTPPNQQAAYWKFGPTPNQPDTNDWYPITPTAIAGNQLTFTLVDGGPGDSDLQANGVIIDPGGPGQPETTDGPTTATTAPAQPPGTDPPGEPGGPTPTVPDPADPDDPNAATTTTQDVAPGGATNGSSDDGSDGSNDNGELPTTGTAASTTTASALVVLLTGAAILAASRRRNPTT